MTDRDRDEAARGGERSPDSGHAPVLDYRRHGEPQRTFGSRHLEPGDGCYRAVMAFLGFVYSIAAIFIGGFLIGPRSDGRQVLLVAFVLLGVPAILAASFRRSRWIAAGILLGIGLAFSIVGACAAMFRGL